MSTRKTEYEAYLKSPKWKAIRKLAIELHPYCLMCSSTTDLHGHHRKYPSVLGTEPIEWITVVCGFCHSKHHQKCCTRKAVKPKRQKKLKTKRQKMPKTPKKPDNAGRRGRCPKCFAQMQTIKKRPEDRKFKAGQKFYFSEWDVCRECKFLQHYEKFKVML